MMCFQKWNCLKRSHLPQKIWLYKKQNVLDEFEDDSNHKIRSKHSHHSFDQGRIITFPCSKGNVRGSMKLVLFKFTFLGLKCFVVPGMLTDRCWLIRNKGEAIQKAFLGYQGSKKKYQLAFQTSRSQISLALGKSQLTYVQDYTEGHLFEPWILYSDH